MLDLLYAAGVLLAIIAIGFAVRPLVFWAIGFAVYWIIQKK